MTLIFKYDIILKLIENSTANALVAQLDRVTGYEPVGRGFEPLQARQKHHCDCSGASFLLLFRKVLCSSAEKGYSSLTFYYILLGTPL